ncbi:MAG: hypothetical protein A3F80_03255 [Candidatus Melainabacteria bacterium RIFCSPLOWO2_12_FULL_35_11]|nr:MAG: hypothetical protein A3F80_03255 [Candidatus Melainabacteria bacterium RIFCSPLOWO2_12_FULL_35_11]
MGLVGKIGEGAWTAGTTALNASLGLFAGGALARNYCTAAPDKRAKLLEDIILKKPKDFKEVSLFAFNSIKKLVGDIFGKGMVALKDNEFAAKLGDVFKGNFKAFSEMLPKLGWRGGLVVAVATGVGALATVLGFKEAINSWGKVSDIKKGYHPDPVNSSLLQGIKAFSGLGIGCGGLALLFGAPGAGTLITAGLVGSFATSIAQYSIGGINWFRYPELAPYPLNNFFQMFRNRNVYEPK